MKKSLFRTMLAGMVVLLYTAGFAKAAVLQLTMSGTFDAMSGLNGVAFGTETPFSYMVEFDPVADFQQEPISGMRIYTAHSFSLSIGGNVYTSASMLVGLADPAMAMLEGNYAAGIAEIFGVFSSASVPFTVENPVPTALSGFLFVANVPYEEPFLLDGGNYLFVNDVTSATVLIVPEPSTWLILGLGGPMLLGALRLRKRKE